MNGLIALYEALLGVDVPADKARAVCHALADALAEIRLAREGNCRCAGRSVQRTATPEAPA